MLKFKKGRGANRNQGVLESCCRTDEGMNGIMSVMTFAAVTFIVNTINSHNIASKEYDESQRT